MMSYDLSWSGAILPRVISHDPARCQINAGKLQEARALLGSVLSQSPDELSARVARGTARALLRDLKGAIEDFDVAVKVEPRWGANVSIGGV